MFHQRSFRPTRGLLLTAAAIALFCGSGCTAVSHYVHHHQTGAASDPKHHDGYFHCPHCGRIVPTGKHHACRHTPVVLPFFGYSATCWQPWPAGWIGCPEFHQGIEFHEECGVLQETELLHQHSIAPEPEQLPPTPWTPAAGHHSAKPAPRFWESVSDQELVAHAADFYPAPVVIQRLPSVIRASSTENVLSVGNQQQNAAQR